MLYRGTPIRFSFPSVDPDVVVFGLCVLCLATVLVGLLLGAI